MWVSRFSMPAHAGRKDLALDPHLSPQRADQASGVRTEGDQLRDRLSALGDDDAVGTDVFEQREALFFELRGSDLAHDQNIALVISSVHVAAAGLRTASGPRPPDDPPGSRGCARR